MFNHNHNVHNKNIEPLALWRPCPGGWCSGCRLHYGTMKCIYPTLVPLHPSSKLALRENNAQVTWILNWISVVTRILVVKDSQFKNWFDYFLSRTSKHFWQCCNPMLFQTQHQVFEVPRWFLQHNSHPHLTEFTLHLLGQHLGSWYKLKWTIFCGMDITHMSKESHHDWFCWIDNFVAWICRL